MAHLSLAMTYGTVGIVATWAATLMPEGIQVKVSSVYPNAVRMVL